MIKDNCIECGACFEKCGHGVYKLEGTKPAQVFLDKDGKEFFRHEGLFSKEEIVKVFDKMGVK